MKKHQPYSSPGTQMLGVATKLTCSLVLLIVLGACGKKDDSQTAGQKLDTAVAKTEQAAADAKAKAESAVGKAEDAMKNAAQKAEASGKKTVDSVGVTIDDVAITASISAELAKDAELSAIKINVDTKNGGVTLNGPAPSAAAKEKATALAKAVKGVTSVNNMLVVKS